MPQQWSGSKRELLALCIKTLGLDTTFATAKKWAMSKYKMEVGEPQFYTVRREMQDAAKPASPIVQAVLDRMPPGVITPEVAAAAARAAAIEPASANGIAVLVKTARALVEKLGKEEAKSLIDAI